MNNLMNPKWWAAAAVRALKTMAQAFLAAVGSATLLSAVDWRVAFSTALLAGILSVVTSVAGLPECKEDGIPS